MRPDLRALYRDSSEAISKSYMESLKAAEKAWATSRAAKTTAEHEYWQSFAETVVDRKIKYVFFEHAAAIGRSAKGGEPRNHLWNLMSLLETTNCMGILNLIPEGHQLWEGRPEISERLDRVFIKPYDVCDQDQFNEFANNVVLEVASAYEIESEDVIRDQIEEIAIATATGMRPVKNLFAKANINAARRGSAAIGADDIRSAFETRDHVTALWNQAKLLSSISRPANSEELRSIHAAYIALSSSKN